MPGKLPVGGSALHQRRPLKRATAKAAKRIGKKEMASPVYLNNRPAKKRVARRGSGRTRSAGRA